MMVGDAMKYPFRSDGTLDAFAAGGILTLATILLLRVATGLYPTALALVAAAVAVVPATALLGYLLRVAGASATGEPNLPEFGAPRPLLADGLRGGAITMLYLGTAFGVLLVTVRGVTEVGVSGDTGDASAIVLVGSTMTMFVALAIAYAFPAALVNAARGGSVRSSLDPRTLTPLLSSGAYFASWVIAFTAGVLAWGLTLGAVQNYAISGLFAVFAAFYLHLVAVRAVGIGYARTVGESGGPL